MSTALATAQSTASLATLDDASMQALISGGDCSKLTPAQRTAYYVARCEAAGLDPRAQPFAYTNLNGKLVLYALKAASDQLAAKHKAKTQIVSQVTEDGVRVVTVRVETGDGRQTEEIGALNVKGLQGEALANALMKAVTKAKRRAILSVCGLGALDETEVESIPGATTQPAPVVEIVPRPAPPPEPPKPAAPAVDPEHARRAGAIWVKAQARGFTRETFPGLITRAIGIAKPSKDWTSEEMAKLEEFLSEDVTF